MSFIEDEYLAKYYSKKPITLVRGYMQYVWDSEGRKYLDANTGFGAAFLGHRNPKVVEAIREQLDKIITTPLTMYSEARSAFIKEFVKVIPNSFRKIFLQNTGTEAVETALKIARKVTRRSEFLAFLGSFHGRTMGSLSVTGNEKYRRAFEPLPYRVRFAPFNATEQVDKLVSEDLAAVIVEPIQGEGGVNPAKPDFLRALRQVTSERNVLLILDEVQTGFGRTGYVWAFQGYGVEPDIFTAGKAVAGGLPIGLVVARGDLGDVFEPGEHGSTFAGNPLVMAAARASVEVLVSEDVPSRAKVIGEELRARLEELTNLRVVLRIKGMGLMLGVELRTRAEPYVDRLIEGRVLATTAGGTTVRLLPPYCIVRDDIETLVNALGVVLRS